jgi:PAS domain S-box-containing protein
VIAGASAVGSPGLLHVTLLVVDDDDVDRERLLRMLRRAPFEIDAVEASSGREALELIRTQAFDCVLLDHQLGDATGAQILPMLKRESKKDCPVIMVTGASDESLVIQVFQDGAADYLPKLRMNPEVLIHSMSRCLDRQRCSDEAAENHRSLEFHVREQALTLQQRERDLQSILDHLPALIGYWDARLHNRFGNRAYQDWFGIPHDRLPGLHMREVIGEESFARVVPHIDALLRDGTDQRFDCVALAPGRALRHCQVHLIPDRSADDRVAGFYSFVTDVTLVKEAQAQASDLATFSEAVIQSSPVGIAVYGADGRCMLSNTALAESVGGSPQALQQLNFRQLASWRDSGLLEEAEATLADGGPRSCLAWIDSCHGREAWLECKLAVIDHEGERCLLLIAHDVSAQRSAQAELADARDVANASHEIRTPMNGIIGLSRLALEEPLAQRPRDFIDKVYGSAVALMRILDDVLDYTKIEAGRLNFEHLEFELEEVLQRVADLFAARILQKDLEFVFEVMPGVPMRLVGDALRLSQVLDNLVGNAVKFTDQGAILVSAALEESLADGTACRLRFAVQDSGMGISPDSQPGLFEAFTQADTSITRRFGGSGLGLAICKRLIQQMDGEIGVDSVPGHGSDFHFTARFGVAPVAVGDGPAARPLAGMRLLVVDDNPVCRRVLVAQLAWLGAQATAVDGGGAALARFEQAFGAGGQPPFDIVLLDERMPEPDGSQTLRRLRRQSGRHGQAPVPVMMMVMAFERESMHAATDLDRPDHVLVKPVLRPRLLQALLQARAGGGAVASSPQPSATLLLEARAAGLRGVRVLLVEDNLVNQIVAAELLRHLGMEVTVVADGRDALEEASRAGPGHFDVVLMDLHMPRMDGFEATRRIHALPHGAQLPVIAMSAAVMPEDLAEAQAAGMLDHVPKPVMPERVVEVLLRWTGRAG